MMFCKIDGIRESDGLENTVDIVIAIIAFACNSKADIDFAKTQLFDTF